MNKEEHAKAVGQFRLQLNGVFEPFTGKVHYGLDIYVPGMMDEIVRLAEQFALRMNGDKNALISLDYIRRRRDENTERD